jgi:hypothetical protein
MNFTRRKFIAGSAALGLPVQAQTVPQAPPQAPEFVIPPPRTISGATRPLLSTNTARPLRYTPVDGDFVIRNGGEFFNRPLYGPNIAFRVDAGDLPEFSLYLPGHGGNLRLGVSAAGGSKWLAQAAEVVARYRPGRMIYEIRDPLLAQGSLRIEVLTTGQGAGFMLQVGPHEVPAGTALTWAFAGASGRKGARNGDIGTEGEPVSHFFQVRPEECTANRYTIEAEGETAPVPASLLQSPAGNLRLAFPAGAHLRVADFATWDQPPAAAQAPPAPTTPRLPTLTGWVPLAGGDPVYILIHEPPVPSDPPASAFAARGKQVAEIAATLRMSTPDPYISASAAAICIAADGIWDREQQCVMHGGVAWRAPLAGWRGPYCLLALGNHDRMRQHVRHWVKRQNVSPVSEAHSPVEGPAEADSHFARKEALLHSNGDLSNNHYDMNMVFFDVFLRYLRWTGDLEFAHEIWPAFERHLAWEQRLFRRLFRGPGGRELPLYEAYAAIWASDNLQYNGGGATHSSAYNVFAFRSAAVLARLLGEDPAPYEREAALLAEGIEQLLWLPAQGAYAESKDLLGAQTVYHNPAAWTVYHTVDSEVPTPRQAWQAVAERLSVLRKIPVHGPGVPAGPWYMLSCSNWLPYIWSLNLLALAENVHTALAMWQVGMADEAFLLFKGNMLDSLFMGLAPGNFHMTSELDAHRQEAQRDSGDPIGITARALTEGLFGIQPDLLRGTLSIRPGFPQEWEEASLQHADLDFHFRREGSLDTYRISSRLPKPVPLRLILRARSVILPKVSAGVAAFDPAAVGAPALIVTLPAAASWDVTVEWTGPAPAALPAHRSYRAGQALALPPGVALAQIDDPQRALAEGRVGVAGFHTVFANMQQGDCRWSLPISFDVKADAPLPVAAPPLGTYTKAEPLDLSTLLQHQITRIFTRPYTEPRSPYCSLAFPEQLLGGWANMNLTAEIDDAGLRRAGGMLQTPLGVGFRTPAGAAPNCLFLSQWKQDRAAAQIPLAGRAEGVYLLIAGVTFPQASRMEHGRIAVTYQDGAQAQLSLRNPETWWPIEQDYLLDDYLFLDEAPLPPRVDLRSGTTRILDPAGDPAGFKGKGRAVPGGAASILYIPLDRRKDLASLQVEASLYGIVVALLAVTLARPSA